MASPEARREYYSNQMESNGFVAVHFGLSGADVEPIFNNFRDVLDETFETPGEVGEHIRNALASNIIGREGDSASFIEQRRIGQVNPYEPSARPATEDKDTLHFTPLSHVHAQHYFSQHGGMPQILRTLLNSCAKLQHEATESVRPIFEDLGIADRMIAPDDYYLDNVHILRLLRYPAIDTDTDTEAERAELHFDRSKFTAAIWEDCSGLVGAPANNGIGDPNLTVEEFDALCQQARSTPIKHQSGEIKLFAGAGYNHMPPEIRQHTGNWPPLLHGVMSAPSKLERTKDRYAVVQFMNEHAAVPQHGVPEGFETGATAVRTFLADRQERHGGLVSP